jgi:hypothetical protein
MSCEVPTGSAPRAWVGTRCEPLHGGGLFGTVARAVAASGLADRRDRPHRARPTPTNSSAFARHYSPPDVIVLALRWYLRFNLSYRDLEELLAERGIEADHGRLKARLRPMRGLKQDRNARVIIAGHALVQNVRRGHYELTVEAPATRRVAVAFGELAVAI